MTLRILGYSFGFIDIDLDDTVFCYLLQTMLTHWTKKIIVEEGHTVAQLAHILYVYLVDLVCISLI